MIVFSYFLIALCWTTRSTMAGSDDLKNDTNGFHMIDGVTALVTLVQFIISAGGILLYILTSWIMIKYRKSTFSNPFYTLAVALAVPDCLHLSMELICAIPSVFIGYENISVIFVAICGFLTDTAYWCLAPLMVVIGINRYVAVCHFQLYKKLFSPFRIKIMIGCCWALGFFLPSLMYGCTCLYLFKDHAWKFYCTGGCTSIAMMTNIVLSSSLTIAVALIYAVIFIQYKMIQNRMGQAMKSRRTGGNANAGSTTGGAGDSDKQSKKEAALMFQFGLISLVLMLYIGSFWLVNVLWTNRYGDMFLNFFVSLNSCISPILYLSFGSEIRARLPWRNAKVGNMVGTRGVPTGSVGGPIYAARSSQIIGVTPVEEGTRFGMKVGSARSHMAISNVG